MTARRRLSLPAVLASFALAVGLLVAAPAAAATPAFVSEDFAQAQLHSRWSVVDPVGDGVVSLVGPAADRRLSLAVPAGTDHDPWNTNRSLRVMQPAANVDFEAEARWTTVPSKKFQAQGLLVQQDANNWMRFDVHHTGSALRLFVSRTVAGSSKALLTRTVVPGAEVGLRVQRSGSGWTVDYANGAAWSEIATVQHNLVVSSVGPFAGNSGPDPAFVSEVDYVMDLAAPIAAEDGGAVGSFPLTVTTVGQGSVARSPSALSYPAGTRVTLTAVPANGWRFSGWSGAASGGQPQVSLTVDAALSATATFTAIPPATASPPVIDVWYGQDQTVGVSGKPQRWVNVLGRVSDPDGVSSLTYSLNGAPARPLSLGPNLRRLYMPGDFNVQLVEADLPVGASTVLLRAVDAKGHVATSTVTVRKPPASSTLPLAVNWSTTGPNDRTHVVDGKWRTGSNGLTVVEMGYDRTVAVGDRTWTDYEATVPVTVRALGPGAGTPQSGAPLVGVGVHWDGHSQVGSDMPYRGWYPTGAYAWFEFYGSGRFALQGNGGSPLVRKSMAWSYGTTYVMKVRAEAVAGGVRYSYKWWPQGTVEPLAWGLSVLEDNGPRAGSLLLIAHHVDATFGNVRIEPL